MSDGNKIKYRAISEGEGGTFRFRRPDSTEGGNDSDDPEQIQYIGTSGIKTCVGVYFKLSDTECFLAHINVCIRDLGQGKATRVCRDDEGQRIRALILEALQIEAEDNGWDTDNPQIEESLLVVCASPTLQGPGGVVRRQTGSYVIDAIKDFLNLPNARYECNTGFVVGQTDGHECLLTLNHGAANEFINPPELDCYEAVPEASVGSWSFGIDREV